MSTEEDPTANAVSPDPTADIRARYAAVRNELAAIEASETAPAVPSLGNGVEPALALKTEAASRRSQIMRLQRDLKTIADEMRKAMEKQMSEMRELMAPMQEQVQQWGEVIQTTNLYLGRDEEIVRLRGGEPSPVETPITIRQMVLSMDEETALHLDGGGSNRGMDHMDIEDFDKWLLADPAHLDQILPEKRGVVALVPRRRGKDYGDPWANNQRNQENRHTYWIIRNGERLYRMDTEFDVGNNLVPLQDEFTGLFRRTVYDYTLREHVSVDLSPGSREWIDAEKTQGARQRHFMKVALILQGLIDRTTIFHPLPEGGVSLLHPEAYAEGKAIMLADGERSLTSNREPFYKWLAKLNAQLRPGMRIIGEFRHQEFNADRETYRGTRYNARIQPKHAERPTSLVIHRIESRDGEDFKILYRRTERIWVEDKDGHELRTPKTRASAVVKASDPFILPIDLVDVPTMREYLNARTERQAYLDMFPLLQLAIEIKETEAAAEAPFMEYLTLQLSADLGVDRADIEPGLREVVDWWKLGNKWHRPLVKGEDPKTEAKAAAMILKEFKARHAGAGNADETRDAQVVDRLRKSDPGLLFVGRRPNGTFLAFARQPRKYLPSQGFSDNDYTREYTLTKTGKFSGTREWVLPGNRAAKTTALFTHPEWEAWNRTGSARTLLTDIEVDALLPQLIERATVRVQKGFSYRSYRPDGVYPDAQVFAVWFNADEMTLTAYLHSPALVESAGWEDANKHLDPEHLTARDTVVKPLSGEASLRSSESGHGLQIDRSTRWYSDSGFYRTDAALGGARPWGYQFSKEGLPTALMEDPEVLAGFLAARERAETHNGARRVRSDKIHEYLRHVEDVIAALALERERERFMEDYQDPEAWEEEKGKRRRVNASLRDTDFSSGTFKHPLAAAVSALVHSGAVLDGQTVAEVLRTAQAAPEAFEQVKTEGIAEVILGADGK